MNAQERLQIRLQGHDNRFSIHTAIGQLPRGLKTAAATVFMIFALLCASIV